MKDTTKSKKERIMTNQDDNNQEIEKVEDVEVETTKKIGRASCRERV